MRTRSTPSSTKIGQRMSARRGAASSGPSEALGATLFDAKPTAKCPMNMGGMEARGIEPHLPPDTKYLHAQYAQIQGLGPGSLPARCALCALFARRKGHLRH